MTAETTPSADFSTDFAADFTASQADWLKAAEAALKGRPLDPVIHGKTIDGVAFDAIRPRVAAEPIAGRPAGQRWTAMTRIDIPDPEAAAAQALEDLNNGASGLSLILAPQADGAGLAADTVDRLDQAFDGVLLDLAPIHLDAAPFRNAAAASLVADLVEQRGLAAADVRVLFGFDLIRDLLRTGGAPRPWAGLVGEARSALKDLSGRGFASPVFLIDQRFAHDAGASEALELASALASAVEHVRLLEAGVEALDSMGLAFSVDANQFAGIAKLRAARLLWAALRREFGLGDRPVHIHAETSRRMMTKYDAQTNMVRTTIAAFAAGVGGADSVVALPHDIALGGGDPDARRIARNTQSIVLDETNAYRVADPAAGAGAIEALTDALAERAWDLFREIEGLGGMLAAITSGAWQAMVAKTRDQRARDVATRKAPIVGVSQFPKADETTAGTASPKAASQGGVVEMAVATLEPVRVAEPFETLRAENEAKTPRPTVFLGLVGPVARHSGRADFIRNLLQAGGLVVIDGPVDADAAGVVEAFGRSGASIAVVAGADADYAGSGAELAKALKAKGATVWLAGKPTEGRAELEVAGVSRFVAAGDDALEILAAASKADGGAA